MKFLITNKKEKTSLENISHDFQAQRIVGLSVITEGEYKPVKFNNQTLFNDGYLRDFFFAPSAIENQLKSIGKKLANFWPLPTSVSGSFSAVLLDSERGTISLATDLIGLYPLYYSINNGEFVVTNSIILAGRFSKSELDPIGIIQRGTGPDFANIGSRTILKEFKRLLPGECRRFSFSGELREVSFDNTLYQNLTSSDTDDNLAANYWKTYKKEVKYCLGNTNKVNIALSGGVDSRIALAAIPNNKHIEAYTFGNKNNYESRIAARLAERKGAGFKACYHPDLYFPPASLLKEYTLETEGVELCSWLEITEEVRDKTSFKEPLLLGELCEALPARKISRFNSRKFRQENFKRYYLQNEDYDFEASSQTNFEVWKSKILKRYLSFYKKESILKFGLIISEEEVRENLSRDLEEIFTRIEAHNLPYTELYDELFSWYTYTRMHLSKQLLTAGSKFEAYSPAMSLSVLRETSRLHPNLRLNYRFIKKLYKEHKELKSLFKIPTNQAPFIPHTSPDLLKFMIWGIRSKIDQYLIKRLMKVRDPNKRYRLLKSINWVQVYQNPKLEKNLNDYFKNNHLGEYASQVKNQALQRRDLKQWPFANMNIINAAALNMEIDLIKSYRDY